MPDEITPNRFVNILENSRTAQNDRVITFNLLIHFTFELCTTVVYSAQSHFFCTVPFLFLSFCYRPVLFMKIGVTLITPPYYKLMSLVFSFFLPVLANIERALLLASQVFFVLLSLGSLPRPLYHTKLHCHHFCHS